MNLQLASIDDLCEIFKLELYPFQKKFLEFLIKNPGEFICYSGVRSSRYYLNGIYNIMRNLYVQGELQ